MDHTLFARGTLSLVDWVSYFFLPFFYIFRSLNLINSLCVLTCFLVVVMAHIFWLLDLWCMIDQLTVGGIGNKGPAVMRSDLTSQQK